MDLPTLGPWTKGSHQTHQVAVDEVEGEAVLIKPTSGFPRYLPVTPGSSWKPISFHVPTSISQQFSSKPLIGKAPVRGFSHVYIYIYIYSVYIYI